MRPQPVRDRRREANDRAATFDVFIGAYLDLRNLAHVFLRGPHVRPGAVFCAGCVQPAPVFAWATRATSKARSVIYVGCKCSPHPAVVREPAGCCPLLWL